MLARVDIAQRVRKILETHPGLVAAYFFGSSRAVSLSSSLHWAMAKQR